MKRNLLRLENKYYVGNSNVELGAHTRGCTACFSELVTRLFKFPSLLKMISLVRWIDGMCMLEWGRECIELCCRMTRDEEGEERIFDLVCALNLILNQYDYAEGKGMNRERRSVCMKSD